MTEQMKTITITCLETVSDTDANTNNPDAQSQYRQRLSRLSSPNLNSPNHHFIQGKSCPDYDAEQSC